MKAEDPGEIEGRRRRGQQKMRWLDSINDSVVVSVSKLSGKDRKAWQLQSLGLQTAGHDLATEQQRQQRDKTVNVKNSLNF